MKTILLGSFLGIIAGILFVILIGQTIVDGCLYTDIKITDNAEIDKRIVDKINGRIFSRK